MTKTPVVFVKPRCAFPSYEDFWTLISLSGFPICYIDEIDLARDLIYVLTPWHAEAEPCLNRELLSNKTKMATVVWWCLERFDCMAEPYTKLISHISELVDQCWISDRWLAGLDPRFQYIPMGSHPRLGNAPSDPSYDFTIHGSSSARCESMCSRLQELGFTLAPKRSERDRDSVLRRSRVLLHVQQSTDPSSAPLLFALAAAYRLPVLSESIRDPHPVGELITMVDYEFIPEAMRKLINIGGHELASALHEKLCAELTFRRCVEAML